MVKDAVRGLVMDLVQTANKAADPYAAVHRAVVRQGETLRVGEREYDLRRYRHVFVLGAGKASAAMAVAVEEVLGPRITSGLVIVRYGYTAPTRYVTVREAGHPIPDERGADEARELARIASQAGEDDLVIVLISGGGSALLSLPADGISLDDKRIMTDLLLRSGATINEVNAVRKHISRIKGGRLAALIYPAKAVSLIVSDVVGDPLDAIASGPTVPDPSTFADAVRVLVRRKVLARTPTAIVAHLKRGSKGQVDETPNPGGDEFKKTYNLIVCSNRIAVEALVDRARNLGFNAFLVADNLQGEASEAGKELAALAKKVTRQVSPSVGPACFAFGGETTVTVRGPGMGGRNQELVLSAAGAIDGLRDVAVASFGTDGTDGPTDAAGAIADGDTCFRARRLGLDWREHLANNDSYHFFAALGDLIVTGPTNTNVNDVAFVLVGESTGKAT